MPFDEEDFLKHYGVIGMRWGHRKRQDASSGSKGSSQAEKTSKINAEILKKNPNAAVVNYEVLRKRTSKKDKANRNKKIRNIAIGLGVGLTLAAGAYLYAKNKKTVDAAVGGFLKQFGKTKVKDLPDASILSDAEIKAYKKLGLKNIKTKQDAVLANWAASWIGHDKTRYNPITDEAYSAMDDNDISLKPGQVLKRIGHSFETKIRDNTYVSFEEDDSNRYAAFLPAMWKVNNRLQGKPNAYAVTMEAVSEIKSPSAKKRVQIYADLIRNDPAFRMAHLDKGMFSADDFNDPLEFAKKNYNKLATELCDRNLKTTKKYLEAVRKMGYNALVDDNDAGRLTKTPLILLNSKDVVFKGTKELTHSDIQEAISKIKPMEGESFERTAQVVGRKIDILEKMFMGDPKDGVNIYRDAIVSKDYMKEDIVFG